MKIEVNNVGEVRGESKGKERWGNNNYKGNMNSERKTWFGNGKNNKRGYNGNRHNGHRYRPYSKYTTILELELHNDLIDELSRIGKERGHTLFKQIREFLEDSVSAYNEENMQIDGQQDSGDTCDDTFVPESDVADNEEEGK